MGEVLSQSEIDNLLNALNSGELDVDEINQELSVASSDNIFSEYIEANSKTETTNSKEEFMALFE